MGRLRDILVLFLLVLSELIHLSGTDNYRSADVAHSCYGRDPDGNRSRAVAAETFLSCLSASQSHRTKTFAGHRSRGLSHIALGTCARRGVRRDALPREGPGHVRQRLLRGNLSLSSRLTPPRLFTPLSTLFH